MKVIHYDYLIIGAGMAAACAAKGIRQQDDQGSIGILGDEADPPATRPALSKKLWLDNTFSLQQIWMNPDQHSNAQLYLNHHAIQLDRTLHEVRCSNGACFHYHRLLIATGGKPTWQQLNASERVLYFRTVADYRRLCAWTHTEQPVTVTVVGGSWLGMELAAALAQQEQVHVQWVIPQATVGEHYFPAELSAWLQQGYEVQGVEIITGQHLLQGEEHTTGMALILENGADITSDVVVMCTGIAPCVELALQSGLTADEGITVDRYLCTSDPNVFAAGDVANYPDSRLGRQRVEHVDNAQKMATLAGANMAGAHTPYTHTPYFYSQLFELKVQGIGRMSTALTTVEHWQTPPDGAALPAGVIYYLDDAHTIRGVALVNIAAFEQGLDHAREVIGTEQHQRPAALLQ